MINIFNKLLFVFILALAITLGGCKNIDSRAVREKHAEDYRGRLANETNDILSMKQSYGLNDCISIALQNNLDIRVSQIEENIAKLERKVAFSGFLPVVNLDYNQIRWNKTPKVKFGSSGIAMNDREIKELTWQMQMSIFDPSTWFLYEMYKRGEELAQIVTNYSKQMTVLEVIVNYYHCLTLQQVAESTQSQLNAANSFEKEINYFYAEGLVTQSQKQQAELLVLARQTELNRIKFAAKQAQGDLLVSMGLSPLADIQLEIQQPLKIPAENLEELTYRAMLNNPRLFISDKQVAIEKEKIKIAIAAFLPRLTIFANRANTSDSFQVYQNFWTYGLTGILPIFNGFANINEYKAAKERHKASFIDREQQTLVLILEVFKAYQNLENAKEETLLAQKAFDTASTRFNEINEKWKEGIIQSSDLLDVLAEKDNAQMELTTSSFNLQVTIATLQNLLGETDIQDGKIYGKL